MREAKRGSMFRHRKRGTTYEVLARAKVQANSSIVEGDELVIYEGRDGSVWARPADEFEDGRFERVRGADLTE